MSLRISLVKEVIPQADVAITRSSTDIRWKLLKPCRKIESCS